MCVHPNYGNLKFIKDKKIQIGNKTQKIEIIYKIHD